MNRVPRSANPIYAMEVVKWEYPRIFKLFRKYSIFSATQNKDERLLSMIGRNTSPQSQSLKVETIESGVVGSAIQKHRRIFNFNKANGQDDSSSDD